MKLACHLFVTKHGTIRLNKTGAGLKPTELAIKVVLDIPERFFTRPIPVAHIAVPLEALLDPERDALVTITAHAVADALNLEIAAVTDGLNDLLNQTEGT